MPHETIASDSAKPVIVGHRRPNYRGPSSTPADRDLNLRSPADMHVLTMLLAMFATTAMTVAEADRLSGWEWLWVLAAIVVTVLGGIALRSWSRENVELPGYSACLVLLASSPLAWEAFSRAVLSDGRTFEFIVMNGLKWLVVGLAAGSCWIRYQRMAVGLSLFLIVFAATMSFDVSVAALVGLYGVGTLAWLIASHWHQLDGKLIGVRQRSQRRRIGLLFCGLLLVAVGTAAGDSEVVRSWRGFLPSGGGDGSYDPYSKEGVGDGDALVAGTENLQSFAPIEDAPFVQDDQPSLYDIMDEAYAEAVPPKNQDRAVGLKTEDPVLKTEHLEAKTEKAGREFSTLRRQGKPNKAKVGSITSDALFYVAGRTPLHLRLEVYDDFDGVNWHPEILPSGVSLRVTKVGSRPWITVPDPEPAYDLFVGPETHAIKVVQLDTNRIPAPSRLTAVHIDLIDRLDMFAYAQPGIIRMDRKSLPAQVPIHLSSSVLDVTRLTKQERKFSVFSPRHERLPEFSELDDVRALARKWTAGVPLGWQQVDAISRRLREAYVCDRTATIPEESPCPVAHFLLKSKRGPDYLFATASAILLRSLGYSTRVVSGFYVPAEAYDVRSRHTPVLADDVHFWTEVHLGLDEWATVEPTPGYSVLTPSKTIVERCLSAAWIVLAFAWHRWPFVLLLAVLSWQVWSVRWFLLDAAQTSLWRWWPHRDGAIRICRALGIIERRLNWSGRSRPAAVTPRRWLLDPALLEELREHDVAVDPNVTLSEFIDLIEEAAFAPKSRRQSSDDGNSCTIAVQTLDALSFRRLTSRHMRRTLFQRIYRGLAAAH